MDSAEAIEAWRGRFDSKAKHLYALPDECWVIQGPWMAVGEWLDAYNGTADVSDVPDAIERASGWTSEEPLLLVRDCQNIVSLTFDGFSKCWTELLAAFDDGPILMSARTESCIAFRFTPPGSILKTLGRR